jgi:hypothetical protein
MESLLRRYGEFSQVLSRGAVFPLDTVDLNPLVQSWSRFRAFLEDEIADDDVFDLGDVLERTSIAVDLFAAEVSRNFQAKLDSIFAEQTFDLISGEIRKISAGLDPPNLPAQIAEFRETVEMSPEIDAFLRSIENDAEIATVAFDLRVGFGALLVAIQTVESRMEADSDEPDEEEEAEEQLDVAAILSLMMSPTPLDVPDAPTPNDITAPPITEPT